MARLRLNVGPCLPSVGKHNTTRLEAKEKLPGTSRGRRGRRDWWRGRPDAGLVQACAGNLRGLRLAQGLVNPRSARFQVAARDRKERIACSCGHPHSGRRASRQNGGRFGAPQPIEKLRACSCRQAPVDEGPLNMSASGILSLPPAPSAPSMPSAPRVPSLSASSAAAAPAHPQHPRQPAILTPWCDG